AGHGAARSGREAAPLMLEFCLVGGGFIGPVHAANIAAHPAAPLRGGLEMNAAAAGKLAEKYGARATVHLDEALHDAAVGAVICCTPPRTHATSIQRRA